MDAADRHLHYGLARWYMRPLKPSVVPIDVITGVLRTRRPYYYHRMLAHALVQTVCCQRILPPGIAADAIVGKLAAYCDLVLVARSRSPFVRLWFCEPSLAHRNRTGGAATKATGFCNPLPKKRIQKESAKTRC
jgi:hypothetical protein